MECIWVHARVTASFRLTTEELTTFFKVSLLSLFDIEGCEEDTCPFGSCQMTPEGPECICADFCAENFSPVCGSDGVTYPNNCYLTRAACRMNMEITVVSEGNCGKVF